MTAAKKLVVLRRAALAVFRAREAELGAARAALEAATDELVRLRLELARPQTPGEAADGVWRRRILDQHAEAAERLEALAREAGAKQARLRDALARKLSVEKIVADAGRRRSRRLLRL
jgi:hypothetical protein